MKEVLIIEDNPVNQMITEAMLRALGVRADIAGTVQEGEQKLKTRSYAMILTDVQLPDGNGIAFARNYLHNGGRIPVVAMTAALQKVISEAECLEAGMVGYLQKPFTLEQLKQALQRHALSD